MRTYGTLRLVKNDWAIDAEPHVILKLKRMFARVHAKAVGTIKISDTEENAADLLWFMERYPLVVEGPAYLQGRAVRFKRRLEEVERLLSTKGDPPKFDLALPARDYQAVAAGMAIASGGLLVADEVGLGKTVTAIAALTSPGALPALVVTLTHLPRQWEREVNRFAPELAVHIVKQGKPYDISVRRRGQAGDLFARLPDVIIINYHKLGGWADTLRHLVKSVVYDECQELRHDTSQKYGAAKLLGTHVTLKIGLSATPIYNYGGEIYNVLDVIRPGVLGTRGEFVTEWCSGPGGMEKITNPKAFGSYALATGLMVRRTRTDVGRELPKMTKVVHEIDASLEPLKAVESSATALAHMVLAKNQARGAAWKAGEEMMMLLRQATGVAKAPFVADFVRMLLESQDGPIVVFAWHRDVYAILMERLKDFRPVLYTGTESATQKLANAEAFITGKTRVLLMSLRAGQGLDGLQKVCSTAVFAELDWSPMVHLQCYGRMDRDGQADPVFAYFLLASVGVDPIIADILQLKKAQSDGILDPMASVLQVADVDEQRVKKLAAAYLEQRGIPPSKDAMDEAFTKMTEGV